MFPPSSPSPVIIDLAALSGICGSISIACWVVVFSPQIIENFQRSSADGLSIVFLVIWLLGDVFNILGAILQGVLPTMIILAVYYTLADIVLISQCFYYRGFTLSDTPTSTPSTTTNNEIASGNDTSTSGQQDPERRPLLNAPERHHHHTIDPTHLSPAMPLHDPPTLGLSAGAGAGAVTQDGSGAAGSVAAAGSVSISQLLGLQQQPRSRLQTAIFNTIAILIVCAAGVLGWWLSSSSSTHKHHRHHHDGDEVPPVATEPLEFDLLGQVFGYLCAILYLGSRIPQLLLNYRRKSTEGVSLLFFLFACIGNLTYDMSIFAYDPTPLCQQQHQLGVGGRGQGGATTTAGNKCAPGEASQIYAKYIAVNASWIAGSLGTLFLDMCIFIQFFLYRTDDEDEDEA